jgi:cytochrome P450
MTGDKGQEMAAITRYPFGPPERLDLHPQYAGLRDEHHLLRVVLPYGGPAWLVTRYRDARTVLADARFSRAATVGADLPRSTPAAQPGASLLNLDPPQHSRLRRLVASAFTARRVAQLRPRTQAIVGELLEDMITAGPPADLCASLAWPLPVTVICELLGVPPADQVRFHAWANRMSGLSGSPESTEEVRGQFRAYLAELVARLVAERRAEPTTDLLSQLVAACDDGHRLSDGELIQLGVTLLVTGHESTASQLGNFAYTLLTRPPLWRRLTEEPGLVAAAVEELLRFTPLFAGGGFPRIVTEDLELCGQRLHAGDAVIVELASANRDESVFDHPDQLDLFRVNNPHVAFGHGAHHCLGAPLARMELQVALGALTRRLPRLRLAVPAEDITWRANRFFRGVQSLPVTW